MSPIRAPVIPETDTHRPVLQKNRSEREGVTWRLEAAAQTQTLGGRGSRQKPWVWEEPMLHLFHLGAPADCANARCTTCCSVTSENIRHNGTHIR